MEALAEDGLPRVGTRVPVERREKLLELPGSPVSAQGIQKNIAMLVLRELSDEELARLERLWA